MKKNMIFLMISMIILSFATTPALSQDKPIVKLKPAATYYSVPCTAGDSLKASDSIWVLVQSDKDWPATQDVLVKLTKVSGNPRVTVKLWGRKFSTTDWTLIGSRVIWTATTSDTTIVISNATDNRYRNYKIGMATSATAQKSLLSRFEVKEYYGAP